MLVLSRQVGQRVILEVNGVQISVMVCAFTGRGVDLGFEAPREVVIVREELLKVERRRNE